MPRRCSSALSSDLGGFTHDQTPQMLGGENCDDGMQCRRRHWFDRRAQRSAAGDSETPFGLRPVSS